MSIKYFAAFVIAPWLASTAQAEWQKSEIKDEMRGKSTSVFSLTSSPISGSGPDVTLMVLDKNDGQPGVVFSVKDGRTEGCPTADSSYCNVNVKFDDGKVLAENFSTAEGTHLVPSEVVAFAGTITKARNLFLEVDLKQYGLLQYKFSVKGLDIFIDRSPKVKVLGFELGEAYPNLDIPLTKSKVNGMDVCYAGENIEGVFGPGKAEKVHMCFYDNVFYSAIVTPGTKPTYVAGVKYLNSVFGKPDPDSIYPSWPNTGDKVIRRSTKRASYLTFEKNKYGLPFIISDEVISPLVPETPKP
ncbi:hypothetical protein [Pseudomonas gessardii]|uniref:Uncharacterized protein n=1 Tax=Pseudomonas gessardii TaxID=78544 RepID=A0A7Y1MVJ2_9PSED|nr:hypothetical protein [Pseudomonas gessardii]NNA99209.1 hypothetical protein [Pseudomonas gessardii]